MPTDWERPSNIPYPQVWFTFEAKDLDTDDNVEYVVQDLPPHLFEAALDHFMTIFIYDEPSCSATEMHLDEVSCVEIREVWTQCLHQKIVVACFRKGSDEIVGLNMLSVSLSANKGETPKIEGKSWSKVYGLIEYVLKQFDVFKEYNVDKYITAMGLSVNPKYRRRGVGLQLLKARKFIGNAIGIEVTATIFTATASQRLAAACGFTTHYEISYADAAKIDPLLEFKNIKSPSVTLGVLKF